MSDALTVSGLTKNFKGFTLSDISFQIPYGSIVGLIGENGAGKAQRCALFWDCSKKMRERSVY